MEEQKSLMRDFPAVGKQQWLDQVKKESKGTPLNALEHSTPDGIRVEPFYTAEDTGTPLPLFSHTDWEVCEAIEVADAAIANTLALNALNAGATALLFHLRGRIRFAELLNGIGIEYIELQFQVSADAAAVSSDLDKYLRERNPDKQPLNLTISYDPVADLLDNGRWPDNEQEARSAYITFAAANSGTRNVCINASIYHEAGATTAYAMACALAHANEYLTWLQDQDVEIKVQVNVAIGADYFTEIARLRALRKVFALLLQQYGVRHAVYLHATTAARNLTIYDQHNNLLRTTTAAMAAVAGGCNSLVVLPYSFPYQQQPDGFSRRMARNIQLILKGESYFDKVSDVAAGAYYPEVLTEELARQSWAGFLKIEAAGGLLAALQAGSIQETIAASAVREQALFNEGKEVLVGTNKFPAANQLMSQSVEKPLNTDAVQGTFIKPLKALRISGTMEQERLAVEKKNV